MPTRRRTTVRRRRNPHGVPASHVADLQKMMNAFVNAQVKLLRALQADGQNWTNSAIGSSELVLKDLAKAEPYLQRAVYIAARAAGRAGA